MKVFKYAICDNEKIEAQHVLIESERILKQMNIKYEVSVFSSGREFLIVDKDLDMILLDVQMEELTGIDVKNILEDQKKETKIVFISNYQDKVYDAFGKNVVGYVNKAHLESLSLAMKKVINEWLDDTILAVNDMAMYEKDLIYLKADGSYTQLYFRDCVKVVRKSIKDYEIELNKKSFYRIHRSYIVNFNYITEVTATYVELSNQIRLNIKRGIEKQLKEAHIKFLKGRYS